MATDTTSQPVAKQKPVFRTMLEVDDETKGYLTGWREPRTAYVLLEKIEYKIQPDYSVVQGKGLMTYNVENRADHHGWKLREYQKKGFRIIHYANFPKLNDNNSARAKKARLYSGDSGKNPWDALEQELLTLMSGNPDVAQKLKDREDDLKRALAEKSTLEAKLQAAEAKMKRATS